METPICQVALSVSDLGRSSSWYEGLGFEPSGGMGPISGDLAAQMLGLPELEVHMSFLLGRESMTQLELIRFSRPAPRPLPQDWGPHYAGYGIVGVVVSDFEGVLRQLRAENTEHTITGPPGGRSIWIRDPDGVPVEILEKDPLNLRGPSHDGDLTSIRTVSVTVGDLQRAKRFWTSAVGLVPWSPAGYAFNDLPNNLDGGVDNWEEESVKGGTLIVRLLKPRNMPIIPRAADYRLSDAGVLNIAAIADDQKSYADLLERVRKLGYTFSIESPMNYGDYAGAIYGHDDQGNSVEMVFVLPGHEGKFGLRR